MSKQTKTYEDAAAATYQVAKIIRLANLFEDAGTNNITIAAAIAIERMLRISWRERVDR